MMAWHKAGVSTKAFGMARALKSLRRSELAYYDRSGLQANSRNRIQQRESIPQLRVLLNVLFDLLFQILDLTLNFVEKAAVRTTDRFIISLVQPVLRSGFLFLEGLSGSRKLLKPALRR